jgi:hypothetical protein
MSKSLAPRDQKSDPQSCQSPSLDLLMPYFLMRVSWV